MAGLMDFLQSASNSAASNVSAPVDGLAWLLRKAGVPVPQNPLLGSDWMAEKGLTKPVAQSASSLLGETAGMLTPFLAAAKAPQIAKGLLQGADNLAAPKALNPQTGAVVWHGSPHKFDAFDSSKIGTGEGAQAYGHGLYLADNKAVAGEYQKALAGSEYGPAGQTAANMLRMYKNPESAASALAADITPTMTAEARQHTQDAINLLQSGKSNTGSMYKVDLPDEHIAKMLDWDKPLSAQHPDVQKMLEPLGYSSKTQVSKYDDDLLAALNGNSAAPLNKINDPMGSDIARGGGLFDSQGQIEKSRRLRELGIPGIRYLDGGSRATGGTSNYVVFPGNEGLLSIMERNGQPLK